MGRLSHTTKVRQATGARRIRSIKRSRVPVMAAASSPVATPSRSLIRSIQSGAHLLAHVRPGNCQAQGAAVPFEEVKRHVVFDETFGDKVSSPPLQRVNRGEE